MQLICFQFAACNIQIYAVNMHTAYIPSKCHINEINMHAIFKLYARICIYMHLYASFIQIYACHMCLYTGRNVHVVCRNIVCRHMHHSCKNIHHTCNICAPYMVQYVNEQYAEICTYMLQYFNHSMQKYADYMQIHAK